VLSVCAARTCVQAGVEFCNQQILLVDLSAVAWAAQVINNQFAHFLIYLNYNPTSIKFTLLQQQKENENAVHSL